MNYTDTKIYREVDISIKSDHQFLECEGRIIPCVKGNRDYDEYIDRIDQGKATLTTE